MSQKRERRSLAELEDLYRLEDKKPLEKVIRALHHMQTEWGADDPYSFFNLAGLHGEPFRGPVDKAPDDDSVEFWGGYCQHSNILFPTWHRAYLLAFEDAMRKVPGCEDVTLPFWDELADPLQPLPKILTSETFNLPEKEKPIKNPLFSYVLQKELKDTIEREGGRYTKDVGYETVRYPLSGLVGTEEDRELTEEYNATFTPEERVDKLNQNLAGWIRGWPSIIEPPAADKPKKKNPPVLEKFLYCLEAENYTVFSNTSSMAKWSGEDHKPKDPNYVFSLEHPHNSIHLAVGGFLTKDNRFNTIPGTEKANSDMGENNTSSFDPIFFLHHCYIDYVFWIWQQRKGKTARNSLEVMAGYAGTNSSEKGGQGTTPEIDPNTELTLDTPLYPFKKPDGKEYYNSVDMTDIEELGYSYGDGTLSILADPSVPPEALLQNLQGGLDSVDGTPAAEQLEIASFVSYTHNRANISGSFVIESWIKTEDGEDVQIGSEAVLSRWDVSTCKNCQFHLPATSLVPVYKKYEGLEITTVIQKREIAGGLVGGPEDEAPEQPIVKHIPKWW